MNPTDSECLLVFLRAPDKGRVKTRLAESLGQETALSLYKCFVTDLLATASESGRPVRLFYTPANAGQRMRRWLGNRFPMTAQIGADLGNRMANAFRTVFDSGCRRAVLVGSDVPDLPPGMISTAFRRLKSFPSVIGPAPDGGYYLVGFQEETFAETVFAAASWGTSRVLSETMAAFRRLNQKPCLLESWPDIDTVADLSDFQKRAAQMPDSAPVTRAFLDERFPEDLLQNAAGSAAEFD